MIEKIKIKYNNLNGSSYIQSNISSNQDGQSYLKERLNEQFLRINDEFMLYINEIFKNKLINDDDLISYNFLKYKEIDSFNILNMINLLIDDKNYHNQLLNDSNNIRKINCLLNYSRQNFIPNQITDLFISHFYENTTDYCKINIDNIDIENFQKYYEYIDIENKYCLMLFDKLSLYFESYDNNQKMILEDKNIMTKEGLIEQLSDMVDILFEKKNFLIYIYILQKYFKKDDIYYKSITDYYFTDYTYVENLITNNYILITNNGFNNLLEKMINNSLFEEVVELIKTLCDNYFLKNIELIANGNYKVYKGVIDDKFNMIDNTLDNFDDLSGEQKKKYNTIINEKIGILKSYEVFDDEDDINNTQDEIDEIIYYFYNTYILPSENNTLKKEYNENFINDI